MRLIKYSLKYLISNQQWPLKYKLNCKLVNSKSPLGDLGVKKEEVKSNLYISWLQ